MSILDKLAKLGDIILKPIEVLTDWTKEPLKKREHERHETTRQRQHEREEQARNSEHERNVELETLKIKTDSEIRIKEKELDSELRIRETEVEANLTIRKETEIRKILVELDEWKKDQEIQRMERVSEAIMRYQEQLTKLNVNATNAIGHMQLELRERAQELVYDKTLKYKELQDLALEEAIKDLARIESSFEGNEVAKKILINAVDKKLSNIIDTAQSFLIELNSDIKLLNQSISQLAEKGQLFIENHLSHFHVAELSLDDKQLIEQQPKLIKH